MKPLNFTKQYHRALLTLTLFSLLFIPLATFAAGTGIQDIFEDAGRLMVMILPMLIAVEFIIFLIGIMRFYMTPDSSSDNFMSGNSFLVFGIVSLFVTLGIFGLVSVIQNTVGVSSGGSITAPQLNEEFDASLWGTQ
jgi:uncharacterized membrane protein